jgi:hypothetical protein
MRLPGEDNPTPVAERRTFLVPLPAEVDAMTLARLGRAVHPGRLNHLAVIAETRQEAKEIATEALEQARQ